MATCFVIQPFDGGKFDGRYRDIFKPAIEAAGFEPYRVDQDPSVSIPIENIEKGIKEAAVCFADITENNPNVLFELGYAIACSKELAIVRESNVRQKFPFDIQHRAIIRYETGTPSDYKALEGQITERLKAIDKTQDVLDKIVNESKLIDTKGGLSFYERVVIATIAGHSFGVHRWAAEYLIGREANKNGMTDVAIAVTLRKLSKKLFIERIVTTDDSDEHANYVVYSLTDHAWEWIFNNEQEFYPQRPSEDDDDFVVQ